MFIVIMYISVYQAFDRTTLYIGTKWPNETKAL